jgi:hypothetical protein
MTLAILAPLALIVSAPVASAIAQPELFTTMPTGGAYPWPFPDDDTLEGKAPPPPAPPAITFGPMFGNSMVLQSAPATATVYGATTMSSNNKDALGAVQVHVSSNTGVDYTVTGAVDGSGNWKATLHPGVVGGSYTITVTMGQLKANITDATFGDVWLPLFFVFGIQRSLLY